MISRRLVSGMAMGASAVAFFVAGRNAGAQVRTEAGGTPEDHSAIEQLLHRYALAIDNLDAAASMECWAPGVVTSEQVDQGMAFHRKYEHTVHQVLNPSYKVQGSTATGMHYSIVSYVKKTAGKLTLFNAYARYPDDQLVKQDGRWVFAKRKWTPIFSTEEIAVVKDLPEGFREDLQRTFSTKNSK